MAEPKPAAAKKSAPKTKPADYCRKCGAKCCRYFTVPLDKPEDRDDFESFRWYILHAGTSIFVDDEGDWFICIASPCTALTPADQCAIYDRRPPICRNHSISDCERDTDEYSFTEHFRDEHELMAYARKFLRQKADQSRKRSQAVLKAWQTRRQKAQEGEQS